MADHDHMEHRSPQSSPSRVKVRAIDTAAISGALVALFGALLVLAFLLI